jgi:hypothetical protein
LNALENARVADRQGQFADEGRSTCCVAGDSYSGIICLIGLGEGDEEDEETYNDSDGCEENFHNACLIGADIR